jgi:hypothetical protein
VSSVKVTLVEFEDVLARLAKVMKTYKYKDIARLLSISEKALALRKIRGSLPVKEIRYYCGINRINFNWVMTGEGEMGGIPSIGAAGHEILVNEAAARYGEQSKKNADYTPIVEAIISKVIKLSDTEQGEAYALLSKHFSAEQKKGTS